MDGFYKTAALRPRKLGKSSHAAPSSLYWFPLMNPRFTTCILGLVGSAMELSPSGAEERVIFVLYITDK